MEIKRLIFLDEIEFARKLFYVSRVLALFQLRDSPMRVLLYPGKERYTRDTLVSSAVLHVALLYKLQHQFPPVRNVWHHVPSMSGADTAQDSEEYDPISLQPTEVHSLHSIFVEDPMEMKLNR